MTGNIYLFTNVSFAAVGCTVRITAVDKHDMDTNNSKPRVADGRVKVWGQRWGLKIWAAVEVWEFRKNKSPVACLYKFKFVLFIHNGKRNSHGFHQLPPTAALIFVNKLQPRVTLLWVGGKLCATGNLKALLGSSLWCMPDVTKPQWCSCHEMLNYEHTFGQCLCSRVAATCRPQQYTARVQGRSKEGRGGEGIHPARGEKLESKVNSW